MGDGARRAGNGEAVEEAEKKAGDGEEEEEEEAEQR